MLHVRIEKRNGFLWGFGATLIAALIFGVVVYKAPPQTANAAGETIVSGGPITGRVNQQIAISNVSISGTGNDTIPVKLQVDSGDLYMTTTTGLTFTGATIGSTLNFTGARSDVNAALATLYYSGTTVGSATLTVSLADQNTIYNPTNGHVYQYVPGNIDWWDARDAAAASTYEGVPGYLATITSQNENDFIKDRLNGDAWLGASDDATYGGEGNWEWVVGPEAGTHIYNGNGSAGGSPVTGQYTNFASGEPNNSGGDENCMETYINDGTWNDLPCDDSNIGGYVVEYGGNGTNPAGIPTANVSITTTAATFAGGNGTSQSPYQITDCERLQDVNQDLSANYALIHNIDCTDTPNWNGGQGFVPIGTNHGGSNPFTGTINGAGYSVDGLTEIRADDDSNTTDTSNNGADYATNQDYVGLVGYGVGVTISGLHLTHAKIKGYEFVGGLIGLSSYSTITDSSVNAGLDESSDTSCTPGYCVWARYGYYGGGLIGYMTGGTIDGSAVGGLVKGSGNVIGGLVGHMESVAAITNSHATAHLDGGRQIGGAVGEMYDLSSLTRVYATGGVIAKYDDEVGKPGYDAGGLVGAAYASSITESYATGDVHADAADAGGLIGVLSGSTVTDAYATGTVTNGGAYSGGLVGVSTYNTIARVYASGSVDGVIYIGGLLGGSNTDTVSDSFAGGQVINESSIGGFVGDQTNTTLSHDYFNVSGTNQTDCSDGGAIDGCIPVNSGNSQPSYLVDYTNAPFTQNSSRIWADGTWYFDGTHYPVLRMGTNSTASARPFVDDNDGVSAAIENAAPNNGDGNYDGIPDSEEANVVSFVNPITNKYVTITVNSSCHFTSATSTSEPTSGSSDTKYSYPFGLVNYTIDCGTPGFSTNVTIYYQGLSSAGGMTLRKYNATTNTYTALPSAVISGSNPVEVTYAITDGSVLDGDGTANGIIVDPVGLATQDAVVPPVPAAPNTGTKLLSNIVNSSPIVVFIVIMVGLVVFFALAIGTILLVRNRQLYHHSDDN